jgi:hypothetical protein
VSGWDEPEWADYPSEYRERVAAGICPASGCTINACRRIDICDCFGWPDEPPGTEPPC